LNHRPPQCDSGSVAPPAKFLERRRDLALPCLTRVIRKGIVDIDTKVIAPSRAIRPDIANVYGYLELSLEHR